jgi:hypothetical protein
MISDPIFHSQGFNFWEFGKKLFGIRFFDIHSPFLTQIGVAVKVF